MNLTQNGRWLRIGLLLSLAVTYLPVCAQSGVSTVYVYMPHHSATSWRFSGKFYVDDKRTAEISKNRYFVLKLPHGKHSFYVRDKKLGGIQLDLAPGQTYYLRVNVDEGGYRVKFRGVSSVPKEEAEFIIKEIQPIKLNDVFDKTFVDMTAVSR